MAEEHGTCGSFLLIAMFECSYVSEYWELERARVDYITLKYYTNGVINEKRGLKNVRWILVGKVSRAIIAVGVGADFYHGVH